MLAIDNIALAAPELVLAGGVLVFLMVGVFTRKPERFMTEAMIGLQLLALVALFTYGFGVGTAFGGSYVQDGFAIFLKTLTLLASSATLALSSPYKEQERINRFEFPILINLATLGMLMMISANDLIALYIAIELQSLAIYVAVAVNRDSVRASEASLKYFVLGALSSGMLLYGMSLIYGFTGSIQFQDIAVAITSGDPSIGVVFGLVFIMAGLAFKLAAVPFHMWTPDVYEGAPVSVTAFLAAAPKLAAMGMLVRIVIVGFPNAADAWQQIVTAVAIMSMLLGAFAAIGQQNLKRLMAYSSIANMGFALVALSANSAEGVFGVIFYLAIYVVMTVGTFACITALRRDGAAVETIDDLKGLSRSHPLIALTLAILMFSFIGIPPFAGFFAKLYAFSAAMEAGLYPLAVIGVLASVVAAYYYLRIVKVMYVDEPEHSYEEIPGRVRAIIGFSALFTGLFLIILGPFETFALTAARTLFL